MMHGYWYTPEGELLARIESGPHEAFASAMCTALGRETCGSVLERWQTHGVPTVDGIRPLRKPGSFYAIRDTIVMHGGRWIQVKESDDQLWQACHQLPISMPERVAMFADLLRANPKDRATAIHAMGMVGV